MHLIVAILRTVGKGMFQVVIANTLSTRGKGSCSSATATRLRFFLSGTAFLNHLTAPFCPIDPLQTLVGISAVVGSDADGAGRIMLLIKRSSHMHIPLPSSPEGILLSLSLSLDGILESLTLLFSLFPDLSFKRVFESLARRAADQTQCSTYNLPSMPFLTKPTIVHPLTPTQADRIHIFQAR